MDKFKNIKDEYLPWKYQVQRILHACQGMPVVYSVVPLD